MYSKQICSIIKLFQRPNTFFNAQLAPQPHWYIFKLQNCFQHIHHLHGIKALYHASAIICNTGTQCVAHVPFNVHASRNFAYAHTYVCMFNIFVYAL